MITEVPGISVGHWTDPVARTGCTVVLLPPVTVGSVEVRGGAPASRELALLSPERTVARVDALVLTGGSAFGLAAADGVMRFCEERNLGFPTPAGPVPIVPALALFDLAVGDASVRPGPEQGYSAAQAAGQGPVELGQVGVGTGATIGNWRGRDMARPGGLAGAVLRAGDLVVASLLAVNAAGDIDGDGGGAARAATAVVQGRQPTDPFANTTIGAIVTNARLDKLGCLLVAQSGHDGLARALAPAHTRADGDGLFVAATGALDAEVDSVRMLATAVVESAVRSLASG